MNCRYCGNIITLSKYHKNRIHITCGSPECIKRHAKEYQKGLHYQQIHKLYEQTPQRIEQKKMYRKTPKIQKYYREYQKGDKRKKYLKLYHERFREKRREYYRRYNRTEKRKKYQNEYERRQRAQGTKRGISGSIRDRFKKALKSQGRHKDKPMSLYGVRIQDIIDHLGPCPGPRKDYHIDHIIPIVKFDLSTESEIQKAFAPENHQWLTKEENLKKGENMGINIQDKVGKILIKIDDADQKQDSVVVNGKEVPYEEAAAAKEKAAGVVSDEVKTEPEKK